MSGPAEGLQRAVLMMGQAGDRIAKAVKAWQDAQTGTVLASGLDPSAYGDTANSTVNYTYILPQQAIRQNGTLVSVKVMAGSSGWLNRQVAFKVFRWNPTTSLFDYVGGETLLGTVDAKGTVELAFTTPIEVRIGDLPGICSLTGTGRTSLIVGMTARYATENIVGSHAFELVSGDRTINFTFYVRPPYLAVTGDSLAEGHNVGSNAATRNHSAMHGTDYNATTIRSIPWPIPAAEIPAQMRLKTKNVLQYQNLGLGSQTFAWVASTGIVQSLAVKPAVVMILAGVNDVSAGRLWAAVEADLNTIAAAVNAANPKPKLCISEILPWTAGSDIQAGTIRTFNTNLAAWCTANGATLMICHDAMGQVRGSTGEKDDLIPAYVLADGVHLTAAGVAALAGIWKRYL